MYSNKSNRPGQRKAGRSRMTVHSSGQKKSKPPMARASAIPAGAYTSRIVRTKEIKTSSGADAVEVIYELTDCSGTKRQMREVLPFDSWPFALWCDAMIAAGLEDGADLSDAVGIEEQVVLEYPDPANLGRLTDRTPLAASSSHKESDEDAAAASEVEIDPDDGEFDDFADFEDEDD